MVRFREVMKRPDVANDKESQDFLAEAESLFGGNQPQKHPTDR